MFNNPANSKESSVAHHELKSTHHTLIGLDMDDTTYQIDEILGRIPILLELLCKSLPYEIGDFTSSEVSKVIGVNTAIECGGIYLFSEKETGVHIYVGRSKDLAQRVGRDHRGYQTNKAKMVSDLIRDKEELLDMQQAQQYLRDNYVIRVLPEQDIITRALLEIYAAAVLKTKYNTFVEH